MDIIMTIADNLQTLIDCKADMKSAIEERGVTVSGGLSTYADAIRQIDKKLIYNKYPEGKEETEYFIEYNMNNSWFVNKETGVWTLKPWDTADGRVLDNPYLPAGDSCYWGYPKWKIVGDKPYNGAASVLNHGHVFYGLENIRYIPYLDVSELKSVAHLFCEMGSLISVGGFDSNRYTDFTHLFYGCWRLRKIPYLDTSNGEMFDEMFRGCISLCEIPKLQFENAVSCSSMFEDCGELTEIHIDFSNNKLTHVGRMFQNCSKLTKIGDFYIDNVKSATGMFSGCKSLTEVPNLIGTFKSFLEEDDYGDESRGDGMFMGCLGLTSIKKINTTGLAELSHMFANCINLTEVLEIDTKKAKNIQGMFASCKKLKTLPLLEAGTVRFDNDAFLYCEELENFGGLKDIGKVTNYNWATGHRLNFAYCTKLTKESLMNIINNLYDRYTAYGPNSGRYLVLSYRSREKLTDEEIAIAINKGWTVNFA